MTAVWLPEDAEEDRDAVRRFGFVEFARLAWPQVESTPLVWNWHLDAMAEHLEAVARREIRDLVINIPPGFSKSRFSSQLWPSWVWTFDPGRRFIAASHDEDISLRDARAMRTLTEGDWYRQRWPAVKFSRDATASTAVGFYQNTRGGFRKSVTTRKPVTGEHCDDALVDDPIDPQGVGSVAELDAVIEWWTGTMPTRFRNHRTSTRTLIMQRLHGRDLTAEFIRNGATVLCLPMRFERAHPHRYAHDPRTTEGELLCAERIPLEEVERVEKRLGPTRTAAQHQQRPSPEGGAIFQRDWLRNYWTVLPPGGTWSQSWDLAFKATSESDYVCGQVWYQHGANHYLVDQVLGRMGFNDTCEAIKALSKRYLKATKKLVEDKANGPAVLESLKAQVPGLVAVEPLGGKEARARAVEPLFAAGNVFLPHPDRAEYDDGRRGAVWVRGGVPLDAPEAADGSFEWFMVTFPNADHDDAVDACTQHLVANLGGWVARMKAAVDRANPAKPPP